jgi:bacillithiol biosynthesis deacetylase BshB1
MGQLGTRGSAKLRLQEAEKAGQVLGLEVRDNLGMEDGWFKVDQEHIIKVVEKIRQYKPDIVIANAIHDRHPDHGKGSRLVSEACFFSGLAKIDTGQEVWRPRAVYHCIQDRYIRPDVIVDISGHMGKKLEAIAAFSSQFYDPNSEEPETPISSKSFLESVKARSVEYGRLIGATHGEGFTVERTIGVNDLTGLL